MKLRLMICAAVASTALFGEDATSATYAVMNVTNAYTDTVIAVPWVGLDGSAITISNLVNTTTLAEGDKLYMYDNGTWYEYTKSEGVWTGATTITTSGDHTAESQVVAAVLGMGVGLIISMMSYFVSLVSIEWIKTVLEKISFMSYYENFTYGILSITDVVFFLSVIALFLFFTVRALEKRRWS